MSSPEPSSGTSSGTASAGGPPAVTELLAVCLERLSQGEPLGLEALCDAHPDQAEELRKRVDRLAALGLLDDEGGEATRPPVGPEQVGPFTIMGLLGQGGMGQVYLAQQARPVRRLAAIKLMHAGMDAQRLLLRFDAERQALAVLRHPGIAAVLEAGATDDGRPWFAMEYVDGLPLTAYCDEHRLTLAERVALVGQVCDAVTHAHQSGILHRDLKPGNVLVTEVDGRPLVKVIDFGLAKALDERGLEAALLTGEGQVVGTPAYMSPEQAGVLDAPVDLRTDVYALGVLLHELLVGRLPLEPDAEARALPEMQRLLRDREPPSPSRAVDQLDAAARERLAGRRRVAPGAWSRQLRGDLDWIVARALDKDRDRRYPAVSALGEDLRRHLRHDPVLAGPPSSLYRLSRLLRRHRREAAVAAVGLVALLVALVYLVASWIEIDRRIEQFDVLAWSQDVDELERRARDELWPEHPGRLSAFAAWRDEVDRLLAGRPLVEAIRDDLESRAERVGEGWVFSERREAYLHGNLLDLLGRLETLSGPDGLLAAVEARAAWAADLARLTLEEPAAEWRQACAAIAASPRYGGLQMGPQLGLLPLGPDPHSGLWEFALPRPGEVLPGIDERGRLVPGPGTCQVLVLLPGGAFHQGAQCDDPSGPRWRPELSAVEQDGDLVVLDPFFVSKYEMTQGQWTRFTGINPSNYQPGELWVEDLSHPVESVSWLDASRIAGRLGLSLPSGAQWEYAARAGRDQLTWRGPGDRPRPGLANLADRTGLETLGTLIGIDDWNEDYDDGYPRHAPVGRFEPNAFGLHDLLGNVWEWCRDRGSLYRAASPRPGDGLQEPHAPLPDDDLRHELRGGSFLSTLKKSRATFRFFQTRSGANFVFGLRLARALDPPGETP